MVREDGGTLIFESTECIVELAKGDIVSREVSGLVFVFVMGIIDVGCEVTVIGYAVEVSKVVELVLDVNISGAARQMGLAI